MIDPADPDFETVPTSPRRPAFAYEPRAADEQPLLSVVVDRGRGTGGRALAATAASVAGQSLQRWELLLGEQGEDEAVPGELAELGSRDGRIRIADGTRAIRAPYVLRLMAGDQLEPTAAEKWLWFLASHPDATSVDAFRVAAGERRLVEPPRGEERATVPEFLVWSDRTDARVELRPGVAESGARETDDLETIPFSNVLAKTTRRLLLVVPWITTGGADKFNLDLVAQLRRLHWEVTVVATLPGENQWAPQLARSTPDVFVLEHFLRPGDYPRFLRYLIESRSPDAILVTNSVFAYRALPFLRRAAAGIPIVDYCHSVHPGWLDGGYPRLSVRQKDHLDLHVTSSEWLKEWLVAEGADGDRIEVCYTNADAPATTLGVAGTDLGLPEGRPVIVYPCRVDVEKQPWVFAKTMLRLRDEGHVFVALVVGDGPYLDWLEKFVARHGLADEVRFLGRRPNAEVQRLIARSDCLFLPSQFEGISLSLFEAMAAGVPAVAADVGGQRELVTEDTGVLVERADEETEVARYAEAVGGLLADPARRRAMGAAGQRRVQEHFRLDDMGVRIDALLESARRLAREQPRATPTAEVARAAALDAVNDLALMFPGAPPPAADIRSRIRWRVFRVATAIGMPIHRLAISLGLHWVDRVRQRVATFLQPKAP